jgi:hypothetical protein
MVASRVAKTAFIVQFLHVPTNVSSDSLPALPALPAAWGPTPFSRQRIAEWNEVQPSLWRTERAKN